MLLASLLLLTACSTPEGAPAGDTATPAEDDALHGRIERHGDRDVLYLWGTREEMGYAEGALYCDRVAPLFKDYLLEHLVGQYSDYTYDVARVYVLATTEFQEDDLRELEAMYQGMVDTCTPEELTVTSEYLGPNVGSRVLELDDLLFANAVADFGCSSFTAWGAASATGDTIHGRNFDWAVDSGGTFLEEHLIKVYDSEEEGARWASVSVPALAGCITCVTEEGVGLTMHNVSGLDPTKTVDISPRMFAARAALAATYEADDVVAAAEAELEARPQLVGNNLHLSFPTARGGGIGAVVFEYDGAADHEDGQVTVRYPGEDPDRARTLGIAATNHYVKRRAPEMDGDSYERQISLLQAIDDAEQGGGIAYDVAIASREVPGARRVGEPQYRHLMGRVFNFIVRLLAIPRIQDTQCGFKVFRREAARDVFSLQTIDGWGFDVEVLFIALKHKYTLIEVPITWYYRPQSRISPIKDSINMVLEVLKVRRNGWRGLYDQKK